MMENKTTTVEIADHNGHTVAQMTKTRQYNPSLTGRSASQMAAGSTPSASLRTTGHLWRPYR